MDREQLAYDTRHLTSACHEQLLQERNLLLHMSLGNAGYMAHALPSHSRGLPTGNVGAMLKNVEDRKAVLASLPESARQVWVDRGMGTDALELFFLLIAQVGGCASALCISAASQ